MDRESSSWSTNFLKVFGKKPQPVIDDTSGATTNEGIIHDDASFRSDGMSLATGNCSQNNYSDEGARGNVATDSRQLNDDAFQSSAVPTVNDTKIVLSTGSSTQSDYPEEADRRNLPTRLHQLTYAKYRDSEMLSSTVTSSAQSNYPEEASSQTSGNPNLKPKSGDGKNQQSESIKCRPIPPQKYETDNSNRQPQQFRSTASNDQPVQLEPQKNQNRNRNERGNSRARSNTNVDDSKKYQQSWRAQDNGNRDRSNINVDNNKKHQQSWRDRDNGDRGRSNTHVDDNKKYQQSWRAQGNGNREQRSSKNGRQGTSLNRADDNNKQSQRARGAYGNPQFDSSGKVQRPESGNNQRHNQFFGFKRFDNFLKMEADPVVLSIHSDIEAFEEYLNESRAYEGNLFHILLAVLSEKVFSDESNLVSYQNDIVKLLTSTEIMNRFRDKCMTLEDSKFKHMYNIVDFMKRRMPVSASDCLSGVVSFCIARLGMIGDSSECSALLEQFKNLFKSFHEKRQNEEVEAKARNAPARGKFTDNDFKFFDRLKPPDDFREICIIPTIEELLSTHSSFLRPNKQSGSYTDAEHYLDVQFRLLREDFLQPLKQGIQEYQAMRQKVNEPRMPKGSPIRLYYNVKCLTAEVKNQNLHYWIQLNSDCKKIKWDTSRRLLPGNLVLLTKNSPSLDSVVFATVGSRNDDDLKKKQKLSIIPEATQLCNFDVLCDDENLLLIESEVYWESFRHVLKTAQTLDLNKFPLEKYIVRACTDVEPPPAFLDLEQEQRIVLPIRQERYTIDPFIAQAWPIDDLGLDADQFEAFRAALSKQFVIIQGPPGTGKTYVGLRVAEVILQNPLFRTGRKEALTDMGRFSEYRAPLLCICYTNHALDQFLEGILNIMSNHSMNPQIVRVGGRSKSKILSEFNLREIVRRTNRQMGGLQWKNLKDNETKMKDLQNVIRSHKETVAELERPTGIIQFEKLDHTVYQTLCFEFSSQVVDRLASAVFFKLTDTNVSNIKEKNPMDIVKKWFEYLNIKSTRKAKVAHDDRSEAAAPTVMIPDVEELYDLDELLKHRIIDDSDDDDEPRRMKFENSAGIEGLHAENMSTLQSKYLINEYGRKLQYYAINDNDTLNVVYEKQRHTAQIRENDSAERKRLQILTEIFHCLNEQRVKIPDVTANLDSLKRSSTMDSKNNVDRTLQSVAQRYAAYLIVAKRAKQLVNDLIREIEMEMMKAAEIVGQLRKQHEVEILKKADVVGMTTTGAAKFNDLLVKMKSRVVIVEEAAEVLEAHIVTSLTKYTDHLILIGDHKQLKPSTAVYDLSIKYDLDVSLFERMVNNNMKCYSLLAQHRMRSDIADLVRGSIYENLNDAPNVHDYEHITGMTKDLFFITHNNHEKSDGDTLSKSNEYEANYIAGLAGYLLKQGYKAESITVLTTYTGQMFLLKSLFTSHSLRPIHITCVDNFQGEENDIILLSLVRSNPEGKMGFLSVSNRVCVALSRAKKGLYIVGNMTMLSQKTLWSEINAKLQKRGQIGSSLKVVCQLHKTESAIATREDFNKKCPEGGCTEMCGLLMKCSHYCPRFCHSQDLDHEDYMCRELCRKPCLSDSAHPCQRQCHFGKVCLPCNTQVHKARSCGHDVTVSCHLSAEEGYCQTKVKRLLKCDHEVTVDCSKAMDDWLCREIVDKIMDCGHETKLLCHDDANQYQCKIEVKKKLPCTHYRNMKCSEVPTSSMCKTFVDRQLPCGHDQTIECRFDPAEVTCSVKVTATLDCEHSIIVPCFQKTSGKMVCHELCEERLGCGHSCPSKCHFNKDRHHEHFRCKKPCAKACPEGHPCVTNHECSTKCKKCTKVVERNVPVCGHTVKMFCFEPLETYKCPEKCSKKLLCEHFCTRKCSEPCNDVCWVMEMKRSPICGHDQSVPCKENPIHENCHEKVQIADTLCQHGITVECKLRNAPRDQVQTYCREPCNFKFPEKNGCLHNCSGTCGSCAMGTLHQKCNDKCLRPLICGHLCNFPCSKNCPPCKEKCQMKCEHSKCKKMCGDACFSCKERCSWKCEHQRCTKLCGEMCNRGPCDEPCEKKLRCGHMCIGFCGEICPMLCRYCDSEKLLEFQLLFTEGEDDARFIWLPDCNHAIEVEGLTMHFKATDDSGEIGLKKCPRCTTVITTLSGRFGNVIRKTFAEVAQVKNKFYGNREQNNRLAEEIQHNFQVDEQNLIKYLPPVKTLFEKILFFEDKQHSLVKKLRQVDINTLNSLQQIWIWAKEILKNLLEYTDDTTIRHSRTLFDNIANRQLPLSAFEVDNIASEIQRLVHKIQFYRRWNSSSNHTHSPDANKLYTQILHILTSKEFYDERLQQQVVDCTKDLEKILKTGLGISDVERWDIIKALNMKQGHWFKCPNGHLYLIGECGGAMETAKCNECGASIGGANHALLGTNRFAPEMDGAVRPAYGAVLAPQNFRF